ncbi:MAG TPA: Hpt domain-containing protein [Bacteroidia bacterium]|nr:Hpt domain-containing protein [Bacteroidia bacterium]
MLPQKVTNLSYLNEISKGDANFIKEMISIFLSESPQEIQQLEKAITEVDFEKIRSTSHHMKSTIPFIGLDLLIAYELSQIEDLAIKKQNIEVISPHFIKVKAIYEQAIQELSE